jgi:hypothetical protein
MLHGGKAQVLKGLARGQIGRRPDEQRLCFRALIEVERLGEAAHVPMLPSSDDISP